MTDVDQLLAWLRARGARFEPITVVVDAQGARHAVARAPIAAGEEILRVPRDLLVTTHLAARSRIGAAIARAVARAGLVLVSRHSLLAAFVLDERGSPSSAWQPYLDALPRAFGSAPIQFGAELELLRGTLAEYRLARLRRSIQHDYDALAEHVAGFARHTAQDFAWARMAVLTRVFGIGAGDEHLDALVPLADMLDHAPAAATTWGAERDGGDFVITALQPFAAGQEVHDSYGAKCNSRFFVHYGFVLPDNRHDEAVLRLPVPSPGDAWRVHRARAIWAAAGRRFAGRRFRVSASYDHPQARRMFAALRTLFADERDARRIAAARRPDRVGPLSARNERAVLFAIAMAATAALERLGPTIADDDAALAGPALPERVRACLLVRRCEKRVLADWLALARRAASLLALPRAELTRVERAAASPSALELTRVERAAASPSALERSYLSALGRNRS